MCQKKKSILHRGVSASLASFCKSGGIAVYASSPCGQGRTEAAIGQVSGMLEPSTWNSRISLVSLPSKDRLAGRCRRTVCRFRPTPLSHRYGYCQSSPERPTDAHNASGGTVVGRWIVDNGLLTASSAPCGAAHQHCCARSAQRQLPPSSLRFLACIPELAARSDSAA